MAALQSKARFILASDHGPPSQITRPQRSPSVAASDRGRIFLQRPVSLSITARRDPGRRPLPQRTAHDPRHIHRFRLRRTHAGAAAVPADRHHLRPAAAADHSASVPSHSLRADRGPDSRGRETIGGQSGADPVQPCVVARHLRRHRAGAGGVRGQKRGRAMAGVRLARAIAADHFHQPAGPAADRRRHAGDRGPPARRRRGGAVRRGHLERRHPRAAVPLLAGRRGASRARRRHPAYPCHGAADVAGLCRPQWSADGPGPARARGVVRRCRTDPASAFGAGVGRGRCHRELGRGGRLRHERGPQGDRARRRTIGTAA